MIPEKYQVKQKLPIVTDLVVGKPKKFKNRGRIDVYYNGKINIGGKRLPITVHLFSCDGSIKKDKGRWHLCADVNDTKTSSIHSCPYCDGHRGQAGMTTEGLTAMACGKVIHPWAEEQGFKIASSDSDHLGGFFLFRLHPDFQEEMIKVTKSGWFATPRYHSEWFDRIVCPIHGEFTWKNIEFDC